MKDVGIPIRRYGTNYKKDGVRIIHGTRKPEYIYLYFRKKILDKEYIDIPEINYAIASIKNDNLIIQLFQHENKAKKEHRQAYRKVSKRTLNLPKQLIRKNINTAIKDGLYQYEEYATHKREILRSGVTSPTETPNIIRIDLTQPPE